MLRDELINDPLARGYAAMSAEQAAASLNEKNRPVIGSLNRMDFLRWAARHDALNTLETAASTGAKANRSIAKAVLLLVHGDSELRVSDPEIMGMVNVLVTNNVFTQLEADDLVALATKTRSRAEELGIQVREGDIAAARAV